MQLYKVSTSLCHLNLELIIIYYYNQYIAQLKALLLNTIILH